MGTDERKNTEIKNDELDCWGRLLACSYDETYIFTIDSLKCAYATPGALQNLGYTNTEISKLSLLELNPAMTLDEFQTYTQPLHDTKKNLVIFETQLTRKDGSTFPAEARIQLALNETPPVYVANIYDISERKQREEALKKAEFRFRSAVEQSPFSVQLMSADGKTLYVNHAFKKLWNIDLDAFENYNIFDDKQLIEKGAMPYIKRGFSGETIEIPPIDYDTSQTPEILSPKVVHNVRAFIYPIKNAHGEIDEVILMHEDVSAHIRAEHAVIESQQRYHALAQISPVGIFRTDNSGNYLYVNTRWREMAGMSLKQTLGKGWINALHPDDKARVFSKWKQAVDKQTPFRTECRFKRADGTVIWFLVQAITEQDATGNIIGYLGTITDISQHKRSAIAIRKIASSVSFGTGKQFFQHLIVNLADFFNSAYALIGLVDKDQPDTITTFVVYAHGKIIDNFHYHLANTPCSNVVGQQTCIYPSHVQQQFPHDQLLADMGVESYIGTPLFESSGKPMGLLAVLDDKSMEYSEHTKDVLEIFAIRAAVELERLRTEKALRESEERFSKAFRSSPDPVIISQLEDARILEINDSFEKSTGFSRVDVIGKTSFEIGLWDNPEDRQTMMKLLQNDKRVRNLQVKFRNKSGDHLIGLVSVEPIELNNKTCLVFIARDITDQKKAEEALAKERSEWNYAMDFFEDTVYIVDLDDKVIRANQAFYKLTGLRPEQVIGRDIISIAHPHDDAALCPVCEARRARKDALITMEDDHPSNPTGSPIEVMVRIIRNDDGAPLSVLTGIHDLSRQREIEDELRRHRDHLEELVTKRTAALEATNKELEAFSYSVSHDLRAPLRAIDGFSKILIEGYADSINNTGKDYLQRVRSASQRMSTLIDDMLKLSRISRGDLSHKQVDLSAIAEIAVNKIKETQPERNVEISIESGIKALGDKHLLAIVLDNLFNNAWKYTGNTQHPKIEFGMCRDNNESVYYIKDNGAGFDMHKADKLFCAFQRLHGKEFEGTGIGLATVQRIIHRHGGRIWAEAEKGKGATFYFTLA